MNTMQANTPKPAGKARPALSSRLIRGLKENRNAIPTIKITVRPKKAVIVDGYLCFD